MTNLRKEARGRECEIRAPGCNGDPSTTVLCHLGGAGMGRKDDDLFAAIGCSACHDLVDGRTGTEYATTTTKMWHLDGVIRTQRVWLDEGFITI
jgi:hypothetical protein